MVATLLLLLLLLALLLLLLLLLRWSLSLSRHSLQLRSKEGDLPNYKVFGTTTMDGVRPVEDG